MTTAEWTQVFDLVRAFVVAGLSIGMAAAVFAAASRS